jgi:hypothetical protein
MHTTGGGGFTNSYYLWNMFGAAAVRIVEKIAEQQANRLGDKEIYTPTTAEADMINELRSRRGIFDSDEAVDFSHTSKATRDESKTNRNRLLCQLSTQQLNTVVNHLYGQSALKRARSSIQASVYNYQ